MVSGMKETEKKTLADMAMDLFACMQTHWHGWEQMVSEMKQIEKKIVPEADMLAQWAC